MTSPLTLSRYKLQTFLTCRRRFHLRYRRQLPWPALPISTETSAALAHGEQFHRAIERHFLGLPVEAALADETLRHWWDAFQRHQPVVENGRILPEHTLTIPIDHHLLTGRFDLLVVGERDGIPFAHIFDWKTGRPPKPGVLRDDWQTRLYLGMVAAGGAALLGRDSAIPPEQITLTYWYAAAPDAPQVIRYNAAWHAQNWDNLRAIVADLDAALTADLWPLTENWDDCRQCAYQVYCGRQAAGDGDTAVAAVTDADADTEEEPLFSDMDPAVP